MKLVAKLALYAIVLGGAIGTQSVEAAPHAQNHPINTWSTYACDTGIAGETITVSFPCKPFHAYEDEAFVFTAIQDYVKYQLSVVTLKDFYDGWDDMGVDRNDYATEQEFQIALLNTIMDWELTDSESDIEIGEINVSIYKGYPTLNAVVYDSYYGEYEVTRLVLTERAIYSLKTFYDEKDEDNHEFFVESFEVIQE